MLRLTCGEENLVKHHKVWKYYEIDCSYVAKTNVAIVRTYFLPLNENHEFDNPLK